VHHSSDRVETDSNYAMVFSFWDRLFGTYVRRPNRAQKRMRLGLEQFPRERWQGVFSVLLQPFTHESADYRR